MGDVPIKDVGLGTLVDDQDVIDRKLQGILLSLRAARGEVRSDARAATNSVGDAVQAAKDLKIMLRKMRKRAVGLEGAIKDLNKKLGLSKKKN